MVRYQALRTILPTFQILQLFEKQSVYRWQMDVRQSAIDIFTIFREPKKQRQSVIISLFVTPWTISIPTLSYLSDIQKG